MGLDTTHDCFHGDLQRLSPDSGWGIQNSAG